jgi:hypothetical protein
VAQCKLPIQGDEMTFTTIEQFQGNDMLPMYKHVRDEGRMMPDGLEVGESWLEPNFSRCFQLMECGDRRLHQEWILTWHGSGASFKIASVPS